MGNRISRIQNDVQDRNCEAWHRLCEYIEQLAESEEEIFAPYEVLGNEHYFQIQTLPESIFKLKKVKTGLAICSNFKRIYLEIGKMEETINSNLYLTINKILSFFNQNKLHAFINYN